MTTIPTVDLPPVTQEILSTLLQAAQSAFQSDLRSVILFGSGAEGRLRATSDLNLLIILRKFDQKQVNAFREPLRLAHVAARASTMFILDFELPAAAEAFAVKFDDIERRHCLLFGEDLVKGLVIPRDAKIRRLRQILLNFSLRLRERYAMVSLREEQLAPLIAESAAPLRSAAATLLELEGHKADSPKAALATITATLDGEWTQTLELISTARETCSVPPGKAAPLMFQLMTLAKALLQRAEGLN